MNRVLSSFCLILLLFLLPNVPKVYGQAWLNDQSFRNPPVPTLPEPAGLYEPPPPMGDLPPSVFDQPADMEQPSGPVWYYPWTWIPLDGWKNSAELGINGASGNAESFSFQTGARFKRKTDFTLFDLRLSHNRTRNRSVETQNNALMFADFERYLGDSKWNYFFKQGLEYDEFKAFDLRYFLNSGLGYSWIKTDAINLTGRFGAGASREFGGPDNAWTPEALFGTDYEHQLNERHKVIAKIDYYPAWDDFSNFRLISDVAWEYLLDSDGNMSLKLGAVDRYDSTPNGAKPNDVNYSALLLYKF